jgi:hypothetical protein
MNSWNKTRTVFMLGLLCLMLGMFNLVLFIPKNAIGGAYLNSAHGNSTYGADRNSIGSTNGFGYKTGLCLHCHEQHASIDGSEPAPDGSGADLYALFEQRYTSQTDNFCLKCHDSGTSSVATTAITNHSYSYRAGGGSEFLSPADIVTAFTYDPSSSGSSHNLYDIWNEVIKTRWNYNSDSNPCAGCHNPHSAQGDPANSPNGRKTTTLANRGWPVSLPSSHNKDNSVWGLWGDGTGEKMSDYISTNGGVYTAPYYYNSSTTYEPGGSSTSDGSNLADFVTFCRDCHSLSGINSNPLGYTLQVIDWSSSSGDTHGGQVSTVTDTTLNPANKNPYSSSTTNYVLACTDCHEPHGSENSYLLRPELNGQAVTGSTYPFSGGYFAGICDTCHNVDYSVGAHTTNGVTSSSDCSVCHSHGAGRMFF